MFVARRGELGEQVRGVLLKRQVSDLVDDVGPLRLSLDQLGDLLN